MANDCPDDNSLTSSICLSNVVCIVIQYQSSGCEPYDKASLFLLPNQIRIVEEYYGSRPRSDKARFEEARHPDTPCRAVGDMRGGHLLIGAA